MIDSLNVQAFVPGSSDVRSGSVEDRLRRKEGSGFSAALEQALVREDSGSDNKTHKQRDKKLWDVCVEAESLFVSKMLKEMRKTVPKGDFLHGGFAEEIFEDMLYDEYSLQMSKTANLGLAKMMYDELSRKL